MALSTVSAVLKRIGLGKLSRLEPLEPPNRYERRAPGRAAAHRRQEARSHRRRRPSRHGNALSQHANRASADAAPPAGWEFVHVCVDDATRLAYVEVLADEKATTAVGFLRRALAFYAAHGITVERVMTDNGAAYRSTAARPRLPRAGHPPPAHPPLPATHQRQGRALHPDAARRLDLRRDLRLQPRTHRRPRRLALDLQPSPTTRRPQPQAAHRSPQRAEQPGWVLHLVRRRRSRR